MVKMSRLFLSVFLSAAITHQAALLFAPCEDTSAAFSRSVTAHLRPSPSEN